MEQKESFIDFGLANTVFGHVQLRVKAKNFYIVHYWCYQVGNLRSKLAVLLAIAGLHPRPMSVTFPVCTTSCLII